MLVCLGTCIYNFFDIEGKGLDLCVFYDQLFEELLIV